MKRRRVFLSAFALVCLGAGCSGTTTGPGPGGGGGGGKGGDDVVLPPITRDSLKRNPAHELKCDNPDDPSLGDTPLVRLTTPEYHNTIRDLIAPLEMPIAKRPTLPLETPFEGFTNHAQGQTPSTELVESLETGSQDVGAIVSAGLGKLEIVGCPPSGASGEKACFDAFVDTFAQRAFRRPLDGGERERLGAYYSSMRATYDFNETMRLVVNGIVQTPQFLYRVEYGDGSGSKIKLTGYEVASRLSYLFWDSMPDADLFAAAADGVLDTPSGVEAQVLRLVKDTRSASALGQFGREWLDIGRIESFAEDKDVAVFPGFDKTVAADMKAGLGMYIDETLLGEGGGLKTLLTSNVGFVSAKTAAIYGVGAPAGAGLQRVELNAAERKGLATQPAILAGLAARSEHSPIKRGVWMMSHIMCQPAPPPPVDLNTKEPAPAPGSNLTKRERTVMEHEAVALCKSCHVQIDGIGFGFEGYDAVGKYRTTEKVADGSMKAVDTSAVIKETGDMDGDYASGIEMIDAIARSEQVAQCFVEHFYRYALSRSVVDEDGCNIARITDQTVANQGDFAGMLNGLVKTDTFRYRTPFER